MSPATLLEQSHRLSDLPSVIVRGLEGEIRCWSPTAATVYGWSTQDAVGKVTHSLFQTEFPSPIEEISRQLLKSGCWEGELVHTLVDGSKVKVHSRWELGGREKSGSRTVFEINSNYRSLDAVRQSPVENARTELLRTWALLRHKKWWWLLPVLLFWFVLAVFFGITDEFTRAPVDLEP